MVVYSGRTNTSALLYDSLRTESVPFEGLLSEGSNIRIEFTSDQGQAASAFNIRFEGERSPPCQVRGQEKWVRAEPGPGMGDVLSVRDPD